MTSDPVASPLALCIKTSWTADIAAFAAAAAVDAAGFVSQCLPDSA